MAFRRSIVRPALIVCSLLAAAAPTAGLAADTSGNLRAILSRAVSHTGTPVSAADSFLVDEANPTLLVHNSGDREVLLQYVVRADEGGGRTANAIIERAPLYVGERSWSAARIAQSTTGLATGRYRVELEADGGRATVLPFRIVDRPPYAESRPPAGVEGGRNIALAALGGKVHVQFANGRSVGAGELIDGFGYTVSRFAYSCESCGWSATDTDLPVEIVTTFHKDRAANIRWVAVDTSTWKSETDTTDIPRFIEVFAARSPVNSPFEKVAEAVLRPTLGPQWIALPNVRAAVLKVTVRSNHGGDAVRIGEVRVIEDPGTQNSVVRDLPVDLARAALGATIVSATSQVDDRQSVHKLLDGDPTTFWTAQDGRMPQDIVLAMPEDRLARIERIVVELPERGGLLGRPGRVDVAVSTQGPRTGWSGVADVKVPAEGQAFEIAVNREARYVRFRVTEAFGDKAVSIASLRVLEAARQTDYVPALERGPDTGTAKTPGADLWQAATAEREPNDSNAQPVVSGQAIRGTIGGAADKDVFALPRVASGMPASLNLLVAGQPHVRFGIDLLDEAKTPMKRLSPAEIASAGPELTWRLGGKERYLQLAQPPTAVVLVWDVGEGTAASSAMVEDSLMTYIRDNAGSQTLALVRYADTPETLGDGFSNDPQALTERLKRKPATDGGRSLFSALGQAAEMLERFEGNRVIVVLAAGSDTRSVVSPDQVWDRLAGKGIRLYAIGMGRDITRYYPAFGSSPMRTLEHGVAVTGGGAFLVGEPRELNATYRRVGEEIRRPAEYAFKATVSTELAKIDVKPPGWSEAARNPRAEIVLDASAGMAQVAPSSESAKIDSVKIALRRVFRSLPEKPALGLRAYGHRLRTVGKCLDTELLVPMEIASPQSLLRELDRLEARGASLPARSLEQALRDFRGERRHLIAITGTAEECDDLGTSVGRLIEQDPHVRLDVIGVALGDPATEAPYRRAAAATGGMYLAATGDQGIEAALRQLLQPRFLIVDASGEVVATGPVGDVASVPAGTYRLRVDGPNGIIASNRLRVAAGDVVNVATAEQITAETGAGKIPEVRAREIARAEAADAAQPPALPDPRSGTALAWMSLDERASAATGVERVRRQTMRQTALIPEPPPPPAAAPPVPEAPPPPPAPAEVILPPPAPEPPAPHADVVPAAPAPPAAQLAMTVPSPPAAPPLAGATAAAIQPQRPKPAEPAAAEENRVPPFTPDVVAMLTPPPPPALPAPPRPPDPAASLIRDVQTKLKALGYSPGTPDGVMGPRTRQAIAQFQIDSNLPPETDLENVMSQVDLIWEARMNAPREEASVQEASAPAAPPPAPPELSPAPALPSPVTRPSSRFIGRALGNEIGAAFDEASVRKLELTYLFAFDVLPPGRSMNWESPSASVSGQVLVGGWMDDPQGSGRTCRSYRQEIRVEGKIHRDPNVSVVCRQADGKWVLAEERGAF